MTRREWLVAAGALAVGSVHRSEAASDAGPTFCFFSKHLPELGWAELGRTVRDIGFGGVDLTVRPKGHVEPARVTDDLPRAVDAIRAAGIDVPMITTAVTSAADAATPAIFAAAARAKIRLIKLGYWHYALADVQKEVAAVGRDLAGLAPLARQHGVTLGFHNHADYIGAAIWDIAPYIDPLDETAIGYYYDPRHAVVEGGGRMWKVAFGRVQPRLKMVAVKDFYWERQAKGWVVHDCPLGEGMVDWSWFAGALARAKFAGPISVHFEYEIPGRTSAEQQARTIEYARRDLAFIRGATQKASSLAP